LFAWLTVEGIRIWVEHGAVRDLVGVTGSVTFVTSALRGDFDTGRRAMQRIMALCEARGYEPETSTMFFLYALGTSHWFEPLEHAVQHARRGREGLIQEGDNQKACYTYYSSVSGLLDCESSLDTFATEVESALAYASRTGNDYATDVFEAYRRLVGL